MTTNKQPFNIRQANAADLPALTELKTPFALHQDRLLEADEDRLLYLVVEQAGTIIGFGLLVFERPPAWSDASDRSHLPSMVDLFVRADCRSQGAGSRLIAEMEKTVHSRGGTRLYVGVDPVDNPRAYQLYLRLGYTPLQTQPYRLSWQFT